MFSRRIVVTAALTVLPGAISYAVAGCMTTEEPLVLKEVGMMTKDIIMKLGEVQAKLFAKGLQMERALLSATRYTAMQVNASTEKTTITEQVSQQALADHSKEIALSETADDIVMKAISQGTDPCGTMNKDQAIHTAEQQLPVNVATSYSRIDNYRFTGTAAAISARDAQHRQKFCTQDEVDAGICSSLGSMPGGSVNTALLHSSATDPLSQEAKMAVINNIVGLPDDPLPTNAANTPAADAYVLAKKQKDAFTGFAAMSLLSIKEENETVLPMLKERSEMYFGDPAKSKAWAESLAAQDPVGIMRDLLQIEALQLKNSQMRIKQGMRMEANFASYLEILNQRYNSDGVRAAETRLLARSAAAKVN